MKRGEPAPRFLFAACTAHMAQMLRRSPVRDALVVGKPAADPIVAMFALAAFVGGSEAAIRASLDAAPSTDIASDKDFPAFADFLKKHRGGNAYSTEMETIGRFQATCLAARSRSDLGAISERSA